jgi:hypothetical protein
MKAQFRQADKLGAGYVIVLGERELDQRVLQVKNLSDGSQSETALGELAGFVEREIVTHQFDNSPHGAIKRNLGGYLDEALASLQF